MTLEEFNTASRDTAVTLVRPCLDIDRWVEAVVDGRPYADRDTLVETAESAAQPFTEQEVAAALAHHPRIGERAEGPSAEASLSRSEQAGLDTGDDVSDRLRAGNAAYEEKFDQVFLIRAAGRTAEQILAALNSRLDNDPGAESRVVADQLRQIAVLRLKEALS